MTGQKGEILEGFSENEEKGVSLKVGRRRGEVTKASEGGN